MSSRMFLPPNYEPICLGYPGRPAHPRHADDPPLLDRTLDLLEHLNDRIALPDLRQLIPRDLEGLQDPIRVFLRDEPMLWDQLVLQYVKPQGGASLGVRPCSTWHVTAQAVRARGDFRGLRAVRRARSNPGPPGFFPLFGDDERLKAGCSF